MAFISDGYLWLLIMQVHYAVGGSGWSLCIFYEGLTTLYKHREYMYTVWCAAATSRTEVSIANLEIILYTVFVWYACFFYIILPKSPDYHLPLFLNLQITTSSIPKSPDCPLPLFLKFQFTLFPSS